MAIGEYIRDHWRGEHSLARSYWLNGGVVTLALAALLFIASGPLARLPLSVAVVLWLFIMALMAVVTAWQLLGIWRSARHTVARTGRRFWARTAQVLVVLGTLGGSFNLITIGADLTNLLSAMHQPMLTDYRLEQPDGREIALSGAINEESTAAVIQALMDPTVELLRITSHGGLLEPALKLARYVAANNVVVVAADHCLSACVLVLAASPYAAVEPGTQVILHRTQPLLRIANPDFRAENELYLRQTMDYYRDFGLPEWAIARMEEEGLWAPSMAEQIRMGLLKYVYNEHARHFEPAPRYCARHPKACRAVPGPVSEEALSGAVQ